MLFHRVEGTNGVTCTDLDHLMKYHIAVIRLQCDISCYYYLLVVH